MPNCANGAAYLIGMGLPTNSAPGIGNTRRRYNINDGCGDTPEVSPSWSALPADVGIAFDSDADRVIFADAKGAIIDGDRILAMCALDAKSRGVLAKDTLVVTGMSNLGLHEAMQQHGIAVEVTDVGDRHVIQRMRDGGFNLGGEKSGHVILHDYATTGDGIIAALQVLKLMKHSGKPIAELADCMVEYPHRQESVRVAEKRPLEDLDELPRLLRQCAAELGTAGRVVARYSGTEPKLRFLVEARSAGSWTWITRLTARREGTTHEGVCA